MASQGMYSLRKLLALSVVFIVLGAISAASITEVIPPVSQPSLIVTTDKDTYYTGENMRICLVNVLKENITFKDDAYGLHFEKWVDEKRKFLLSIADSSGTSTLSPLGVGEYKAVVAYELGEIFSEGKYRVVSIGEISQRGQTTSVEAYTEFNVTVRPSPPASLLLLEVTTDKAVYHEGDNITITIKNTSNQTVTFASTAYGVVFEKWVEDRWVFHSAVAGVEVIVSLEPDQTHQITVKLSNNDQPFTSGEYRVLSSGWIEQDGQYIQVWGYAEFLIE